MFPGVTTNLSLVVFLPTEELLYEFRVCQAGGLNCALCGTVEAQSDWLTVFCPKEGLIGTLVTVDNDSGGSICICEIEMHGEIIADTGKSSSEISTTTSQNLFSE